MRFQGCEEGCIQMVLIGSKEERGTERTEKEIRCHLSQAISSEDINPMDKSSVHLGTERI